MPDEKAEVKMAGGLVSSSKIPGLHLIPTEGLIRLARRFELGIERKGNGAWNALSSNQECLVDRAFILERIGHVISHALSLRDKILRGAPLDGEDDSAAIGWGAMLACCATRALADQKVPLNCSACGGLGQVEFSIGHTKDCPACKGTGKQNPK